MRRTPGGCWAPAQESRHALHASTLSQSASSASSGPPLSQIEAVFLPLSSNDRKGADDSNECAHVERVASCKTSKKHIFNFLPKIGIVMLYFYNFLQQQHASHARTSFHYASGVKNCTKVCCSRSFVADGNLGGRRGHATQNRGRKVRQCKGRNGRGSVDEGRERERADTEEETAPTLPTSSSSGSTCLVGDIFWTLLL